MTILRRKYILCQKQVGDYVFFYTLHIYKWHVVREHISRRPRLLTNNWFFSSYNNNGIENAICVFWQKRVLIMYSYLIILYLKTLYFITQKRAFWIYFQNNNVFILFQSEYLCCYNALKHYIKGTERSRQFRTWFLHITNTVVHFFFLFCVYGKCWTDSAH